MSNFIGRACRVGGFFVFVISLLFLISTAQAYQVEPMIHTIEPAGRGSTMQLTVTNTNSSALALEFSGLKVSTDADGAVSRDAEYEDLMIFPMQTSIPPGRSQVVQVRYVGNAEIERGRVYAVKVEQLPVALGIKSSGDVSSQVKIGLSFISHILVQPASAKPELVFDQITLLDNGELSFSINNVGAGTALLKEMEWTVTDTENQAKKLTIESLNTGSFGAQIPNAPKREVRINADALIGLGTVAKISAQ